MDPKLERLKNKLEHIKSAIQTVETRLGISDESVTTSQIVLKIKPSLVDRLMQDSAFNAIGDLVFLLDLEGQIMAVNPAVSRRLGYEGKELMGQSFKGLLIQEGDQKSSIPLISVDSQGRQVNSEVTLRTKNNEGVVALISLSEWREGHEGNVIYYICTAKDIRSYKESEKIAEQERITQISSARIDDLAEMAGGMAHEINTPLAAISLGLDQINDLIAAPTLEKPIASQVLTYIVGGVNKISSIIKSLRNIAQHTDNEPLDHVSISKLANEVLDLYRERCKTLNIEVKFESPKEEILTLCRRIEISQALMNLIENSIDAVKVLPEKWLKISISDSDEWTEIRVVDSGSGIPEKIRQKIFHPFYTTKDIGKGIGIGLSVSKKIIENHHGTLLIDGTNKNTCLNIFLPKVQQLMTSSTLSMNTTNKVIVSNRSYLVGINFDSNTYQILKRYISSFDINFLSEDKIEDLHTILSRTRQVIGVIINFQNLKEDEVRNLFGSLITLKMPIGVLNLDVDKIPKEFKSNYHIFLKRSSSSKDIVDSFLNNLIPKRFNDLLAIAAGISLKSIFPLFQVDWDKSGNSMEGCDNVVICDMIVESIISKCFVKVNSKKLADRLHLEPNKLLDAISEFTNQLLGVLSYNFSIAGLKTKIGLPFKLSLLEFESLEGHLYYPQVQISDSEHTVSIGFRFHKPSAFVDIKFGDQEFVSPANNIEFL